MSILLSSSDSEKHVVLHFRVCRSEHSVGRFAQSDTAALLTGAAVFGETSDDFTSAEAMIHRSNAASLLADLRRFFLDNPTWK